jgi:tRNA uridine 5-carboxymethylaminomethyl modification enzyme
VREQVEIQLKYEGYIHRQSHDVDNFKKLESRKIPIEFDYTSVKGFSREVVEKLKRFRPHSLGQASRLEGVTPAAITLLHVALERVQRT